MTESTAETSFDDDELILIEKTTGTLCRLTKQQLQSSINTDTTYNNGSIITIDSNKNINLNNDLTSVNSITSISTSDLTIGSGNSSQSGDKIIFKTNVSV